MKWFNEWFANKVRRAWEDAGTARKDSVGNRPVLASKSRGIDAEGIRMTLHKAVGGYAIEFEKYDNLADRMIRDLHIIHDDDNLGESISQAITYHLLKNT